ncbi:MAG: hypothetical protein ABFD03_10645 [Clostridiaceae bacterium]|nr:hypothetical protein [Feifaniaceae bacterium]
MVTVKEAVTKKDLVDFMEFPLALYRDNPYYVPDILASQVADMQKDKNPAFAFCDAKCFLAYRDGKMVGRIAGILNTKANVKFGKKYMNFTHIDFIDDDEVVDSLFDTLEGWARALGCEAVHGPLGFSDMDREGMLVEGFDRLSLFYTYYNHPYYKDQLERRGYAKQVDWLEVRLTIPDKPDETYTRIANYVKKRMKLHLVSLNDKPIKILMRDMFKLYNDTYQVLFGMVPMTDEQMLKYTSEFRPMVDARTTSFVYNEEGEMVAFGICCPALDHAMQKMKGRTLPFGWIPLLRALKGKNDTVDLLLIAVRPDLQGLGVNAIILDEMMHKLIKAGFKYAESGPMLEINEHILSQWARFENVQHKRRRCFVKELSNS